MDAFYDNAVPGFGDPHLFFALSSFHDMLIRDLLLVLLVVLIQKLVNNLSFFQTAMSDRCQCRIPVTKTILTHHTLHVRRFHQVA